MAESPRPGQRGYAAIQLCVRAVSGAEKKYRKKSSRTRYPESVTLSIDSSNPFLSSSELHALAAAVRDAGSHDEGMWIEWKGTLDLGSPQARIHLVKVILGFANRDPVVAARRAGGFAYLLVGVEPENVRGVTTIDHSRLAQSLEPYVGPHVRWIPEYIKLDDKDVLVIVVDPPKPGNHPRHLRKELKDSNGKISHSAHTIFVRENARTVRASNSEIERIQQRVAPITNGVTPPYRELDELALKVHGDNPVSQRNSLAMLERIGVDHPRMRQLVIDNVCYFLRSADDTTAVEPREFAQAILTRRLTGMDNEFEHVDDGGAWESIDIDLTGAQLVNIDWRAGSIATAFFKGAQFLGDTCISGLEIQSTADFSNCKFSGNVIFTNTRFDSCDFSRAIFEDDCTFHRSEIDGMANFVEATFEGEASFRNATFRDVGVLNDLHFEMDAIFEGTEFCGDVHFDGSHFEGVAQFEGAKFHKIASFRSVTSRRELDFSRACAFSSYLRVDLPPGWSLGPYASCVAIVRDVDIPEQDRGKSRPVFGSGYCTYCTKAKACSYL